jgi:hypothetical protein
VQWFWTPGLQTAGDPARRMCGGPAFAGATAWSLLFVFCILTSEIVLATDYPRGFFVEDLRRSPPVPAFYNLDTHTLDAFSFRQPYSNFIDITWDRDQGRVFFSARLTPKDPYRVYLKSWPDGEEKAIYENPLGPFRFLLSPDGRELVLQVMGPSAWPILAVHDWENSKTTLLGQGFSPDWASDGKSLLFLEIPGSLPSYLAEYRVDTGTTTFLLKEPVAEAIYSDNPDVIVLKTAKQSKSCDEFQLWDRRRNSLVPFSVSGGDRRTKHCTSQREIGAFPGHQFVFFKESPNTTDLTDQTMIITDAGGSRLQTLSHDDWDPMATAVETATLVIGEDPLYVMSADGAGGSVEVPHARFIRYQH